VLEGGRAVASDLVFLGRRPEDPTMMAYAVPSLVLADYREAIDRVEQSWRTID
jgi:hypothetical protein